MAIKHVVTRGFGFSDGTKFIPTRGYSSSVTVTPVGLTLMERDTSFTLEVRDVDFTIKERDTDFTIKAR